MSRRIHGTRTQPADVGNSVISYGATCSNRQVNSSQVILGARQEIVTMDIESWTLEVAVNLFFILMYTYTREFNKSTSRVHSIYPSRMIQTFAIYWSTVYGAADAQFH